MKCFKIECTVYQSLLPKVRLTQLDSINWPQDTCEWLQVNLHMQSVRKPLYELCNYIFYSLRLFLTRTVKSR